MLGVLIGRQSWQASVCWPNTSQFRMNVASEWLARSMAMLRKNPAPSKDASTTVRPMAQRLKATLRRGAEPNPPHVLRKLLEDLRAAADEQISEVEGARHAQEVMAWYGQASAAQREDLWQLLCEQFGPDGERLAQVREQFAKAQTPSEVSQAEIALRKSLVSARTRVLQRFSVPQGGMRFLVDLRAELLSLPKSDKRFAALDAELEYLFSNWFDVAFLELRSLNWDSPASLLEKLIQYEAVHDIRSWADLKNRLDSDRRCYAFFHPRLPNEPLIFVEVALLGHMAEGIGPLLDENGATQDLNKATTAIFYSISNTQNGLRGVSFGNSLIKHVVETLLKEFPKLKTFATLSPIPGLRSWLSKQGDGLLAQWDAKRHEEVAQALKVAAPIKMADLVAAAEHALDWKEGSAPRKALTWCAAQYLARETHKGRPLDAVARFHLGNGARVERLNWGGDPSAKGMKQSFGMMVNYLYDLKRLDKHRAMLAQGKLPISSDMEALCKGK